MSVNNCMYCAAAKGYNTSQEMIEGGITSRMSGIIDNAGHHPSPQDYRYYFFK